VSFGFRMAALSIPRMNSMSTWCIPKKSPGSFACSIPSVQLLLAQVLGFAEQL